MNELLVFLLSVGCLFLAVLIFIFSLLGMYRSHAITGRDCRPLVMPVFIGFSYSLLAISTTFGHWDVTEPFMLLCRKVIDLAMLLGLLNFSRKYCIVRKR